MRTHCVVLTSLLILTVPSLAAVHGTDVLLPATGAGLRATISVTNPSVSDRAELQLQFLVAGAANGAPHTVAVSLAPAQTAVYENIAEAMFRERGVAGAVRIHASRDVLVSSRLYTRAHDDDPRWLARSFAPLQTYDGIARGRSAVVDGLHATADSRYELLLFETGGASATAHVTLRDGSGISVAERSITLAPFALEIVDATTLLGATRIAEGSVRVDVIDGEGRVVASGSLIANSAEEVADFPMKIVNAVGEGRGDVPHRDDSRRAEGVLPLTPFASIAPPLSVFGTKNFRPKPNVTVFSGTAQLISQPDSTLFFEDSTGNAEYLIRSGVHSTTAPGAFGVTVAEANVFAVRTDGGFVAKSQNYNVPDAGIWIPAVGSGTRLMWHPQKGAFRAGTILAGTEEGWWDDANVGFNSWAGSVNSRASGYGSFAFGPGTDVGGDYAVGLGFDHTVSGTAAFAAGYQNTASAYSSVAIGSYSIAVGDYSVALGSSLGACGNNSVALGSNASTSSAPSSGLGHQCDGTHHNGAFIFGDSTSSGFFGTSANNEYAVRAAGGFRFRTSADLSTGCNLPAGSGTFSCTSDRNLKNAFIPLDGEDVLAKLAAMPIETWSFLGEQRVRHAGPAAQDFYAAFGLGTDDKSIGLTDINGVALKGVQALELRTRALPRDLAAAQAEILDLRERLDRIETLLAKR